MNIFITGIHGFVGSNLVDALKAQHIIYGLDIVSPPKDGVIQTFGWNELKDIPPIDCIIHLAGKAHDTKNQTNAQVYFDINTGLTQQLFDWFLTTNASKFIFFSSVKAVANEVTGDCLTEDVVPAPKGPYGESKLAAEEYILSSKAQNPQPATRNPQLASRIPQPETRNPQPATWNKKIFILRPCMIHGVGNKGNLNLLYQLVRKGFPWPLGAFENKRSFCSVGNLIYTVQQLIEKDIEPGIYQVADDEALSTNELIGLMAASRNKKAQIWRMPVGFIKALFRSGDFLRLPINSDRLQKLTESYVVSNQKLKTALGIEKMPVSAEEGMKKTLESFQG